MLTATKGGKINISEEKDTKSVAKNISVTEAHNSLTPSPVAPPPNLKPVVRQIMVPPSLAASLQASGRQLMVVTGPGGKKMVALKPLIIPQGNGVPNNGNSPIRIQAPSHSSSKSSSSSITLPPNPTTSPLLSLIGNMTLFLNRS